MDRKYFEPASRVPAPRLTALRHKGKRGYSVLATRKPLLLFRFVGLFLLRFAERRFCGLLFQEPPRRTRREGTMQG